LKVIGKSSKFRKNLPKPNFILLLKRGVVKWGMSFAHPQFLKKSPSRIRSLERRRDLVGFRAEKFGSSS